MNTHARARRSWKPAVLAAAVGAVGLVAAAAAVAFDGPAGGSPPLHGPASAPLVADRPAAEPAPAPARQAGPRSRYTKLLRRFAAPQDYGTYGDFYDYGHYPATAAYAGQTDLPAGYWVYLHPDWYIFESAPGDAVAPAGWSPEQAVGKPDTPQGGDVATAWASATADGQREWLDLAYAGPVDAVAVVVYESYNPGAVDRVTAMAGNEEVEVWAGVDPSDPLKPKGVSVIAFKTPVTTAKVRLHLDSPRVPGWNEIDAVGLLGADGTVHWATGATASSSWATRGSPLNAAVEISPRLAE
ncbi:MAG TPA: hypothetical protein VF796_03975 [Humisphaera sp.]